MNIKLKRGNCLELMKEIPDGSVDMILCDLPYGATKAEWDSKLPLEELWMQYRRVIKPQGNILLFAIQPFSSELVQAAKELYSHTLYWKKNNVTGALNAKKQPMRCVEEILVFIKHPTKDNSGLYQECREYLISEQRRSGKTLKELQAILGNQMTSHYFTQGKQFTLPPEEAYRKLQTTGAFTLPYTELEKMYIRGGWFP